MPREDSDDEGVEIKEWSPLDRFTPDEYHEYEALKVWSTDSKDWVGDDGFSRYETYWDATITQWCTDADAAQQKWKNACKKAIQEVEFVEDASAANFTPEKALAYDPLDIAWAQVQEQTALLSNNLAVGQVTTQNESEFTYIAALNKAIEDEMLAAGADELAYDTIHTGQFFNVGWWKTGVDFDEYGANGQMGRLTLDDVDPSHIFVDPKAKTLSWKHTAYIIQEHSREIGEIRQMYPRNGIRIPDDAQSSMYDVKRDFHQEEGVIDSRVPKLGKSGHWKRQNLKVYEAWFKDTRLKFVPEREDRNYVDENGNPQVEVDALKVDEDGYVLGDWVPRYRNGRCIVVCEGVVLEDMPNRLPHGRSPFIAVKQAPSKSLFIPGDATRIIRIARKQNDILARAHSYGQSEIERPMHAEVGVFSNAQYWKRIPNKSDRVIPVNPGKALMRPPPTELPQFTWVLLDKYDQYMDRVSGSSAVMRGTLSDGAQLSAEAMSSLQNYASSRLALKAKFLASARKELTFHFMWLIRRTYDENITFQVPGVDGEMQTVSWDADRKIFEEGDEEAIAQLISKESYIVDIKAGTGTPNAEASQQATADKLYDRKCLTKEAYLDAYKYPQRQQIVQQLDEQAKQDVAAEALGRTVGLNVKRLEKESGPGRREKADA